jgi:hypothetical protein
MRTAKVSFYCVKKLRYIKCRAVGMGGVLSDFFPPVIAYNLLPFTAYFFKAKGFLASTYW